MESIESSQDMQALPRLRRPLPRAGGDGVRTHKELGTIGLVVYCSELNAACYLTAGHVVVGDDDLSLISDLSVWHDVDDSEPLKIGYVDPAFVQIGGTVDCGLIIPQPEYPLDHPALIRGFNGYPRGLRSERSPIALREPVWMFSRKLNRISCGFVTSTNLNVQMTNSVFLSRQILIHPAAPADSSVQEPFGLPGDSGSAVLDAQGRLLGLFVGVQTDAGGEPDRSGAGIVCRFTEVQRVLGVALLVAQSSRLAGTKNSSNLIRGDEVSRT